MTVPFSAAATAYGNASKLISSALKPAADMTAQASQGPDFAKLLSQAVQGGVDAGKVSDQKSLDLVSGKGNLVDVLPSAAQTHVALEGLATVRDRVTPAYEP